MGTPYEYETHMQLGEISYMPCRAQDNRMGVSAPKVRRQFTGIWEEQMFQRQWDTDLHL